MFWLHGPKSRRNVGFGERRASGCYWNIPECGKIAANVDFVRRNPLKTAGNYTNPSPSLSPSLALPHPPSATPPLICPPPPHPLPQHLPSPPPLMSEWKQSDIYVAWQDSTNDRRILNCHVIIDDCGTVVANYRKLHLFAVDIPGQVRLNEGDMARAGTNLHAPVQTPIGRIGLATVGICYTWFKQR